MKAFLINLDRATERLAHMRSEFERFSLEFIRVPAVDGALLEADVISDFHRRCVGVYPGRWLPGEIGCFLSHLAIWRQIALERDEFAAVFEDDLHLAADTRALLSSKDWIPTDADIVRLEANRRMHLSDRRPVRVAPRRSVFRIGSDTWGSGAYIISRPAARRLIAVDPEFHCWLDVFLFNRERSPVAAILNTYQVVPAVCIQDQLVKNSAGLPSFIRPGCAPSTTPLNIWDHLKELLPWKKRCVIFRV